MMLSGLGLHGVHGPVSDHGRRDFRSSVILIKLGCNAVILWKISA